MASHVSWALAGLLISGLAGCHDIRHPSVETPQNREDVAVGKKADFEPIGRPTENMTPDFNTLQTKLSALNISAVSRDGVFIVTLTEEHLPQFHRIRELVSTVPKLCIDAWSPAAVMQLAAFRTLPQFTCVRLHKMTLTESLVDALEQIPHLREVRLYEVDVGKPAAARLGRIARIRALDLSRMNDEDGRAVLHAFAGKSLRQLGVHGKIASPELFDEIAGLDSLESLSISYVSIKNQDMLFPPDSLANLTQLSIFKVVFPVDLNVFGEGALRNLKHLSISDSSLPRNGVLFGAGSVEGLEHLSMIQCNVSCSSLEHLGELRSLKELVVHTDQVLDGRLAEWMGVCQKLRKVDVLRTSFENSDLNSIAALPELSELHIDYSRINNDGLKALRSAESLKRLSLKHAGGVSAAGIAQSGLGYLEHVDIRPMVMSPDRSSLPTTLRPVLVNSDEKEGGVFVWDVNSGELMLSGAAEVGQFDMMPINNGRTVIAGISRAGHVTPFPLIVVDTVTGTTKTVIDLPYGTLSCVDVSGNGLVGLFTHGDRIQVHNLQTGELIARLNLKHSKLKLSPSGTLIAIVAGGKTSLRVVTAIEEPICVHDSELDIEFSPNEDYFLTRAGLFSTKDGSLIAESSGTGTFLDDSRILLGGAHSEFHSQMATTGSVQTVRVCNVPDMTVESELTLPHQGGKFLAVCETLAARVEGENIIRVYALDSGRLITEFSPFGADANKFTITSLAFASPERIVATAMSSFGYEGYPQ